MSAPYKKLTVIGLGLIGSSIARAARKANIAQAIAGVDSNELSLGYAQKHGFIDSATTDAAGAVQGSDVIIIATPTHLLADICASIAPHVQAGALVMDTGSVKQIPLAVMSEFLPEHALVVPAHPIAGSEHSGVAAGRDDLLEKKRVIITPDAPLSHEQLHKVAEFWQALGAHVEAMPAALHDTVYGYISHLPQLLAFAAAPLVAASENELESNALLSRFLRISASDRALWSSIFLLNREVMLVALNRYLDVVMYIRKELSSPPGDVVAKDSDAARLVLFPRVVSSCLITTAMEAEKKSGLGFVRFAGTGFADFTSPATTDPEGDMEDISSHYAQMVALLDGFIQRLKRIHDTLQNEEASALAEALE